MRAALIALYLFARLRGLSLLPIFLDETLHVRWALLVSQGEKPWDATWKWGRALTIWLGALVSPWAEDLLRANRLVSVAIGLATLLATVEIARRLLGERAALVAGLFYVLCPFTLFYDRMALTEAGLSATFALALLFSIRMAESGRTLHAVVAGLMLVLAVLVKAIGVLVLPIPLVTLVVLGGLRERWKTLALVYAVGLPPVALALRLFVASENAQHMAQLFTGGGGALAARLGQNLAEGAGWLWTWWTAPLAGLGLLGALVALWRRDRKGLLLALLAAYPLVAFSAVLTWRMPRYLLPASVPLLVLAAGTLERLSSWVVERLPPAAPRWAREGLRAAAVVLALLPALRLDRAFWTDPSQAAMPGPDRFQYVVGWPSGYGVRDTERLVREELERHPDGVTVVVHANRYQNLRMTPLTLGLAFAREPRVRLEDWDFADPTALQAFEKWAAAGPTLLVVPRADPSAPAPPASAWSHLATLVARTTKPEGQACDDVYRLCAPPGCAGSGPSGPSRPSSVTLPPVQITRIRAYRVALPLHEGSYKWSGGKSVSVFDSTVVSVETDKNLTGWGEVCPLGPFYLPAYGPGARTGIAEIAPHLIGLDPRELGALNQQMDAALKGHPYVKSAIDMACWDVLGKASGVPVATLLGGRFGESVELYRAISQESAPKMAASVAKYRGEGYRKFQLKVGGDPDEDIARIRAVRAKLQPSDVLVADANTGWLMHQAARVVRAVEDVDVYVEQPCLSLEECLAVRRRTSHPFVLDETIDGVDVLLRAHAENAMDVINLKISKLGGLTKARQIRDLCVSLGIAMTIEDSWGGDITTAAIAHLAHSTPEALRFSATDFNSYVTVSTAEGAPKRKQGKMAASSEPGLGVRPRVKVLGRPLVEVTTRKKR